MSNVAQTSLATTGDTIFAELFQQILRQTDLQGKTFEQLVHDSLKHQYPDAEVTQQSAAKSNLMHELTSTTMTAKVFFKGLAVLGIESVGLHVTTAGPEGKGAVAHAAIDLK